MNKKIISTISLYFNWRNKMKKLIVVLCIAASSLTATFSYASDNHMSREEFKSNCELSGGTYSEDEYGGQSCDWPNGAYIYCDGTGCFTGNESREVDDTGFDSDFDQPQSKPATNQPTTTYEGPDLSVDSTINKAEIQPLDEPSDMVRAMIRLEKMERIIREKMIEDILEDN